MNLEEIKRGEMKKIIFIFIIHSLWAQPPEWDFNPADYEYIMSVTAVIISEEVSYGDILAAFNEQDECVGVSTSTTIPFGPYVGQEAFLIQVYSNSFSGGETISLNNTNFVTAFRDALDIDVSNNVTISVIYPRLDNYIITNIEFINIFPHFRNNTCSI